MISLIDFYTGSEGDANPTLSEMRLGSEPAMALLFTADAQETRLHYIGDESVRSYVVCPGTGCPACHCGVEPRQFNLLPVFDVAACAVKVLRVSARRQQDGLGPLLLPHLRDKAIASKLILISRNGATYTLEARLLAAHANRGEAAIKAFLDELQAGLKLETSFPRMSPEELAEVPAITAKLAAIGGWQPPGAKDQETPDADSEES